MYISDKPNYPLIQTLLDSLYHDLRLLVDPPDGSKQHPASTCLELWLCHPNYTSGQSPPLSFIFQTCICLFMFSFVLSFKNLCITIIFFGCGWVFGVLKTLEKHTLSTISGDTTSGQCRGEKSSQSCKLMLKTQRFRIRSQN